MGADPCTYKKQKESVIGVLHKKQLAIRKKMLYLQMKELFDSIATQNAEIRTVAKSLPLFLK